VGNFREVYDALAAAKAVIGVTDVAEIVAAVKLLIETPGERDRITRQARACVERFTGALDCSLVALEPYLAALGKDHEAPARA
jgi:3-deoxy-D-manno-octulosonic-acid transferase